MQREPRLSLTASTITAEASDRRGYDDSQAGAYFVTIYTQHNVPLFGKIVNGAMRVNEAGRMMYREWNALQDRFPNADLDAFVVMPNRIHGIIVITNAPVGAGRATTRVAPTGCPPGSGRGCGAAPLPAKPTAPSPIRGGPCPR